MLIFNAIQNICTKKGVSISKVEKECELGNGIISGWKKSSPRIDTLKKVADYLGVSIETLLEDNSTSDST